MKIKDIVVEAGLLGKIGTVVGKAANTAKTVGSGIKAAHSMAKVGVDAFNKAKNQAYNKVSLRGTPDSDEEETLKPVINNVVRGAPISKNQERSQLAQLSQNTAKSDPDLSAAAGVASQGTPLSEPAHIEAMKRYLQSLG
jgi:hypothetical protein